MANISINRLPISDFSVGDLSLTPMWRNQCKKPDLSMIRDAESIVNRSSTVFCLLLHTKLCFAYFFTFAHISVQIYEKGGIVLWPWWEKWVSEEWAENSRYSIDYRSFDKFFYIFVIYEQFYIFSNNFYHEIGKKSKITFIIKFTCKKRTYSDFGSILGDLITILDFYCHIILWLTFAWPFPIVFVSLLPKNNKTNRKWIIFSHYHFFNSTKSTKYR